MIMELNFSNCHKYTRSLFMSMAVCHPHDKAEAFCRKYIPDMVKDSVIIENPDDRVLFVETKDCNYFGFAGTQGTLRDWFNNLNFLTHHGFHRGIFQSAEKIFPLCEDFFADNEKPILWCGQSQGDPLALISNYLTKKAGYSRNVESIGFSGPYVASKKVGISELKRYHVCNTHIEIDGDHGLWGDPTDDVGGWQCKHYGTIIKLKGIAGPFEHAYSKVMTALATRFVEWKKPEEAAYLLSMMEVATK